MRTRAARVQLSAVEQVLLLALELSAATWKLVFMDRRSGQRRRVDVRAWDQAGFVAALERAKQRLGLAAGVRVISCQEAGRDGFSVHRFLVGLGVESLVIDAASLSVKRKRRQAKTDRLDGDKLMDHLGRYLGGELGALRILYVPSEQAEDRRRLHRELEVVKAERKRIRCRIHSALATVGLRCRLSKRWGEQLEQLRDWNGSPLPPTLLKVVAVEWQRLQHVEESISELKRQRQQLLRHDQGSDLQKVRALAALCAVGEESSWQLVMECFSYRRFDNARQVGAYPGLAPTPYASGESCREQGIGKDGNRRLRWLLIELAWMWLRRQPHSALSRWYRERFGGAGKRHRRIGIVALARRLFIALWRYVEQGIVPQGALLKANS